MAFDRVPVSTTAVLPPVLVAGLPQLGVPFTVKVAFANRMTWVALFLNTRLQPGKFEGGEVEIVPLTALNGDR